MANDIIQGGHGPRHVTPESNKGYAEASKFMKAGSSDSPEMAVLVNDTTNATNILDITAESVAIAAGAAGTTGTTCLDKAPIYDVCGAQIGCLADSSVTVTSSDLDNEEAWDYTKTDAQQIALFANGDFRIDYRTGKIIYKKKSTGTSIAVDYKTRQTNIEITASAAPTLGSVKIEDGSTAANKADVNDADTARGTGTHVIAVQAIDAAGNVISQYAEDAAHSAGDLGFMALGVRKDVAGPFGADGDYCPPQYDATGALRVAATLGASFAEDSAHTTGDDGTQILCVRKDARGTNVDTDGDYASMLQNANGEAYVHDTDVATVLGTIDTDTGIIAGDTTSMDTKMAALGTAAMVASSPVTIATDDTMFTALDAAVDIIAGDTTSMDTKMAALGTAVMVGSSPVTIATDDTMFVALDTAVDIIAGDTTSMDTKMPALGVAVSAASSPVVLASDDAHLGAVGISADPDGPIHAQLHSIATACSATSGNTETMDDWDEDNRCKSNPIVGQAGVAANRGTADALTQRVAQARDLSVTTATGAGAIATTTSVSANWKLNNITVHLSAAPTTSQDLDISIDANDGAAYDTILLSQDLAASSATDLVYKPVGGLILESGDEIKVAYTNSDGGTFGLRIVGEKI